MMSRSSLPPWKRSGRSTGCSPSSRRNAADSCGPDSSGPRRTEYLYDLLLPIRLVSLRRDRPDHRGGDARRQLLGLRAAAAGIAPLRLSAVLPDGGGRAEIG